MSNDGHRGVSLHTKILLSLVLGAVIGSIVNIAIGGRETPWLESLIKYVFNPIGQVFLAMLFMTVIHWSFRRWRWVFHNLAVGKISDESD